MKFNVLIFFYYNFYYISKNLWNNQVKMDQLILSCGQVKHRYGNIYQGSIQEQWKAKPCQVLNLSGLDYLPNTFIEQTFLRFNYCNHTADTNRP